MKNLKNSLLIGKKLESLECENKLCRSDGDGCLSIVTGGLQERFEVFIQIHPPA